MKNGKVYKIVCPGLMIYIGSTFDSLPKRFFSHKIHYGEVLNGTKTSCESSRLLFEKYGINKCKIILIKEYQVYDRKHLRSKEQLWINKHKKYAVNKVCSYNPIKKHLNKIYKANWEKRPEYREKLRIKRSDTQAKKKESERCKEYYQKNKDRIKKRTSEYYKKNRNKALDSMKIYRDQNKDEIKKKQKEKIQCECGFSYSRSNKARHLKTKKHQKYVSPV